MNILKAVGIFHDNSDSAAKHLIKIWDDIPSWWNSNEVQNARKEFCKNYSYSPLKPLKALETIFKEITKV